MDKIKNIENMEKILNNTENIFKEFQAVLDKLEKNQKAPYLFEIQMIRQNQFDPDLLSKIISQ